MRKRKLWIIIVTAAFLILFGLNVAQKENQLANGTVAVLELSPVDPFSLMQGHYMLLDFRLAEDIERALADSRSSASPPYRGTAVIALADNKLAYFVRLHQGEALQDGELLLRYKVINKYVQLASGAFFFQEGHAELYDEARYGELRLDRRGNPLVAGLLDQDFKPIQAAKPAQLQ